MNDLLYVCSPYRGDTKRNKEYARKLTRAALDNGFIPVTVHLYLTEATDDTNPEERVRGMAAGMKILENCKYILVGDRYGISEGMKAELTFAAVKGKIYRRLVKLADEEDKRQGRQFPEYAVDTIAVVALLHDVCKADAYKVEKKNQKQKDGSWQQVDTYGYTNNFPVGHGEKSIIQIMRFMYLTEEEVLAIRWHMGAFDNAVKGGSYDMNYAFAQSRLAAMLHIADMMATHLDERTEANE